MMLRITSLLLLASSVALAQKGVPSKVTFVVSNDAGQVVTNATVEGCFLDLSQSGGRDRFRGTTDKNGLYVASGSAVLGVCAGFSCQGYYPTEVNETMERKRTQDHGQPGWTWPDSWDVEIPILLKRIRNQIPMYVGGVENPYIDLWAGAGKYNLNSTSCYDLLRGSFLPPNGKGEIPDIAFKWKMTIYTSNKAGRALEYDTLCEILVTNVVDGICRGIPDGGKGDSRNEGSAYISAYEAPSDGYTNTISFYRHVRGAKAESNDDRHYLYYFRLRTQTNDMGKVTNALYGKIYGQINGNFTYLLNMTPNDRNIEEKRKTY